MRKHVLVHAWCIFTAALLLPCTASAQLESDLTQPREQTATTAQRQPPAPEAQEAVERAVKRFGIGVQGGVALDPELIDVGAHARFGPIFTRNVEFRPGVELGIGEVTTLVAVNLDVLYTLPGATQRTRWMPYVGAGPNFSFSHRGFEADADDDSRFDFGEFDANAGFNFIAGARTQGGLFVEMKATAYGVSNVRLLAGFNF